MKSLQELDIQYGITHSTIGDYLCQIESNKPIIIRRPFWLWLICLMVITCVIAWIFYSCGTYTLANMVAVFGLILTYTIYTIHRSAQKKWDRCLDNNSPYQLANHVVRANKGYSQHLAYYRAWYDAVQSGIPCDEGKAKEYGAFLERAQKVLMPIIRNLEQYIAQMVRNETLCIARDELSNGADSRRALIELIATPVHPIEDPLDEYLDAPNPIEPVEVDRELIEIEEELNRAIQTGR